MFFFFFLAVIFLVSRSFVWVSGVVPNGYYTSFFFLWQTRCSKKKKKEEMERFLFFFSACFKCDMTHFFFCCWSVSMQILFFFVSCWQLYAIFSPTVILNQTVKEELFNRLSLLKTYVKCIISTCCSRFSFTYLWLRLPLLAHLTFSCKPVYGKRGKKKTNLMLLTS